jgi:hypothetical protein
MKLDLEAGLIENHIARHRWRGGQPHGETGRQFNGSILRGAAPSARIDRTCGHVPSRQKSGVRCAPYLLRLTNVNASLSQEIGESLRQNILANCRRQHRAGKATRLLKRKRAALVEGTSSVRLQIDRPPKEILHGAHVVASMATNVSGGCRRGAGTRYSSKLLITRLAPNRRCGLKAKGEARSGNPFVSCGVGREHAPITGTSSAGIEAPALPASPSKGGSWLRHDRDTPGAGSRRRIVIETHLRFRRPNLAPTRSGPSWEAGKSESLRFLVRHRSHGRSHLIEIRPWRLEPQPLPVRVQIMEFANPDCASRDERWNPAAIDGTVVFGFRVRRVPRLHVLRMHEKSPQPDQGREPGACDSQTDNDPSFHSPVAGPG